MGDGSFFKSNIYYVSIIQNYNSKKYKNRAVRSFFMVGVGGGGLSKNVSHHGWLIKKNLAKTVP